MTVSNKKIRTLLKKAERGKEKALDNLQAVAGKMSAEDWQNWFYGVVVETQKISTTRQKKKVSRRALDGRIWDKMSPEQTGAAHAITRAVELRSRGVGFKTARLTPREAGHAPDYEHDFEIELMVRYLAFVLEAKNHRVDIGAVVSVLVLGEPCSAVDSQKRRRKGWAQENLFHALDLYAYMRRRKIT